MASVYDLLARCIDWATGNAKVQLTGSSVQEPGVIMTEAQRDIVLRAYENIFGLCNGEAIIIPMWETSGNIIKCITNSDIEFEVDGATLGEPGLLHPIVKFDGVNDAVREKPKDFNRTINGAYNLDLTTTSLAQRIKPQALSLSFVTLYLKLVGSLPSASLQVSIVKDNEGLPTGSVVATSSTVGANLITSAGGRVGFSFSSSINLKYNTSYWIVLSYSDTTGVDTNNYIAWQYDNAMTYGYGAASYTSSWQSLDYSFAFELYSSALDYKDDLTVFVVAKNTASVSGIWRAVFTFGANNGIYNLTPSSNYYLITGLTPSPVEFPNNLTVSNFHVFTVTLSKAKNTGKVNLYIDGIKVASGNGTAGATIDRKSYPMGIGCLYRINNPGGVDWAQGSIGNVIICHTEMDQVTIQKIVAQLYSLSLRGV